MFRGGRCDEFSFSGRWAAGAVLVAHSRDILDVLGRLCVVRCRNEACRPERCAPLFCRGGAILIHWVIQMGMRGVRESRRYLWISFVWAFALFAACLAWTVPNLVEFASYYVSEKNGTTRHNPIYMSFGGSLIGMPICAYAAWVTWRSRNDDPKA